MVFSVYFDELHELQKPEKKIENNNNICKILLSSNSRFMSSRIFTLCALRYVVEQHAVLRHILLHSFYVQPAGRLVKDCGHRRYGIGTAFWRPQPVGRAHLNPRDDDPAAVRDGTGRDDLFDISITYKPH